MFLILIFHQKLLKFIVNDSSIVAEFLNSFLLLAVSASEVEALYELFKKISSAGPDDGVLNQVPMRFSILSHMIVVDVHWLGCIIRLFYIYCYWFFCLLFQSFYIILIHFSGCHFVCN